MADLIDRQAAIDALIEWYGCKPNDIKAFEEIIEALPSAQPRMKGKWIDETFKSWGLVYHPYRCNQCGEHSEADSNFCPNCGADMRNDLD